jgi:integrase
MSVQKNPRKNRKGYIYRFTYLGKEYKEEGFKTLDDADRAQTATKHKLHHSDASISQTLTTFSQGYNSYLDDHCKQRFQQNTWRQKTFVCQRFIQFMGNDPLLASIEPTVIRNFLNARKAANDLAGLGNLADDERAYLEKYKYLVARRGSDGNKVANRDLKDLKAFFNWAGTEGGFRIDDPTRVLKFFGEDEDPRYIPPFEDFLAVLEQADDFQVDFIQVCMHTLGRLTEILSLRVDDIDFKARTIELTTRKRGGKGLRRNKIVMSGPLLECLHRRVQELGTGAEYVFPHPNPKYNHYSKHHTVIKEMLDELCEKANVKRFTSYAFRHFGAITLVDSGVTLREIKTILRHTRMSTTDEYLEGLRPSLQRVAEVLGLKLPAKGSPNLATSCEQINQGMPTDSESGKMNEAFSKVLGICRRLMSMVDARFETEQARMCIQLQELASQFTGQDIDFIPINPNKNGEKKWNS